MNIDITSFFFNSSIEGGTATCAWGTSIGQNATKECRVEDEKPGVLELLTGMVYKSCADTSKLDISAGSSQRDLLICSLFEKVFVNGIRLDGCKFIITLVRELSPSHKGRLIISYPSYAKYDNEPINKNTIDKMATAIGCTATGCWFVYDISVRNQDELHFSSIVVDAEKPQVYTGSSSTRSKYWQSLIPDNKDYSLAELGAILKNMYDNAESGKQVAMLFVFVFQYGQYLVDIYKSKEIIDAAGLSSSYSTEIDKAYNVYRYVTKKKLQLFFNANSCNEFRFDSKQPLQQIFYGAPGTGKSNTIKCEVEEKKRIHFRTTFHPDSDYSTFVGCYKPTMKAVKKTVIIGQEEKDVKPLNAGEDSENKITYDFVPQAFTKAYCEAWNKYDGTAESEPVFLIIEEINRGNCAQIFGDIFQLLDRETVGERTGFSTYPIDADEDLKKFLMTGTKEDGSRWLTNEEGIKDGKLCLPPNLYIWATMNTSDQSLFPIDSAFKRRWDWTYIRISEGRDKDTKEPLHYSFEVNHTAYDWWSFLKIINERIGSITSSEDKKLGYFFCGSEKGNISAQKFVSKVCFYLWNDVFKDFGFGKKDQSAAFKKENGKDLAFDDFYMEDPETFKSKVDETMLENFIVKLGVETVEARKAREESAQAQQQPEVSAE